jgi:MFS transporter, ACS family, tartrate transporter
MSSGSVTAEVNTWSESRERARAVARFMTATAIAGVVGGPVCGIILSQTGLYGLAGWQCLFLFEGLPAVLLGVVVLVFLTDRPEHARWLAPEEREWLVARLDAERAHVAARSEVALARALTNGTVWALAALHFVLIMGFYGISLWLPQIVKGFSGLSNPVVCSARRPLARQPGRASVSAYRRRWARRLSRT